MYSFQLKSLLMSRLVVSFQLKQVKSVLVESYSGKVLVCHGHVDGTVTASLWQMQAASVIVCCHPATIKQAFPQFASKIVGDWTEASWIAVHSGKLLVAGPADIPEITALTSRH